MGGDVLMFPSVATQDRCETSHIKQILIQSSELRGLISEAMGSFVLDQ